MALVLKKLCQGYHVAFDELSDRRTDDHFLMSSPIYPLLIIASYMYLVQVLGPKLMENRKPFNIKNMLIGYNILQVVWNAYIFYKGSEG
ncbi:hypothetical protein JTB14_013581 [Gonioctena quinquepunctata]|nr:hypothetical protein JTB14_013581 [Gonioctena quinquepunctata]